jgi:hypothetical protein
LFFRGGIVFHEEIPGERGGILVVGSRGGGGEVAGVEEENGVVGAGEIRGYGSAAGTGSDYYVVVGGVGEFGGRGGEDGFREEEEGKGEEGGEFWHCGSERDVWEASFKQASIAIPTLQIQLLTTKFNSEATILRI